MLHSRTKNEFIRFIKNNVGVCRHCDRPLGVRKGNYFLLCYFPPSFQPEEPVPVGLLVSKSAFRCPNPKCYTRHQFLPFDEARK